MDLCANLAPEDRAAGLTLAPGARALVPTGLALAIPPGYEVQVRPRSGLALRARASRCSTAPGTIDSDYRGEVGVILINHGAEPFTIAHGDAHRPARARAGRPHRLGRGRAHCRTAPAATGGFGSTGTG